MNKERGFTIIELIVVIAIIAILAGIVLVNVTQYINKAKDAAIAEEMRQLQTSANTLFNDSGSYTTFSSTSDYTNINNAIHGSSGGYGPHIIQGRIMSDSYCLLAQLNESGRYWCVDSSGNVGKESDYANICYGTHYSANTCH